MSIENHIDGSFDEASTVGIFDTDEVLSVIVMSPEIAVECSSQPSYMEITCRRWSEAGTDGHRK